MRGVAAPAASRSCRRRRRGGRRNLAVREAGQDLRPRPRARGGARALLPPYHPARSLPPEGIVLIGPADTSTEQRGYLTKYFRERLLPVLTPLAIDAGQPFPYLGNRSPLSGGFDPSDGAVRLSPHHLVGDPPSRPGNAALHQGAGFCPPAYVHPARRRAPAPPVDDLHGLRHRLESCHSRHS